MTGLSRRKGAILYQIAVLLPFKWTQKVLDVEIMRRFFKSCAFHHHLPENSENYIQWKVDHINCNANFKGSAPAIEQEGTFRIFQ